MNVRSFARDKDSLQDQETSNITLVWWTEENNPVIVLPHAKVVSSGFLEGLDDAEQE